MGHPGDAYRGGTAPAARVSASAAPLPRHPRRGGRRRRGLHDADQDRRRPRRRSVRGRHMDGQRLRHQQRRRRSLGRDRDGRRLVRLVRGLSVGCRTGWGRWGCARRLGGAPPRARRVADRQRRGSCSPRPDADHAATSATGPSSAPVPSGCSCSSSRSPNPAEMVGLGWIPGSPPLARCRSSSLPSAR